MVARAFYGNNAMPLYDIHCTQCAGTFEKMLKVGELHATVRARHVVADLDDTDPGEGWGQDHQQSPQRRRPLWS